MYMHMCMYIFLRLYNYTHEAMTQFLAHVTPLSKVIL